MDKNTTPKKEARQLIEKKIEVALTDLKPLLGEKEFESRIKKAAKIFAKGFKAEKTKTKVAETKEKTEAPKEKANASAPKPKTAAKKAVKKAAAKKK